MYLIRDVFNTKPGKAKDLVAKFKQAIPHMQVPRVMTDTVAAYWTVIVETEVEELNAYFDMGNGQKPSPEMEQAMQGYKELLDGGHREIFRIE
jgi:hypothetical protein